MPTIFSQIVDGDIPARVVHEDETTFAFLDANPLAPGHTLVIPKADHGRLNDIPVEEAADLYATIHRLIPAVEAAVDADATTVAFNNGEAAGQEVPHVHLSHRAAVRGRRRRPDSRHRGGDARPRRRRTGRHRRRDRGPGLIVRTRLVRSVKRRSDPI